MRDLISRGLRVVLGLVLAGCLMASVVRAPGVDVLAVLRAADPGLLLAATAAFALGYPLMIARWRLLLRVQGLDLQTWTLLRLLMAGNFFTMVVPGAVGGDVARAACLAGQVPGRRVEALLTIFVDRLVGAVGLLTLVTLATAVALPLLGRLDGRIHCVALVLVVLGGLCLVSLGAVLWRERWGRWLGVGVARRVLERVMPERGLALARRAVHALDQYRREPGVLVSAWLVSVGVHVTGTLVVVLLAWSLGERGLSLGAWLLAVQVANCVAVVPLTPGGLGGRDITLFYLLRQFGADPSCAAAIPVLYSAVMALWALMGGIVYLCDPLRARTERTETP